MSEQPVCEVTDATSLLQDSEDGGDDNGGIATNSLVEVETSHTDDDGILYQLADRCASMDWSDPEGSDTNTGSNNNADDEGGEGSDSQWDDPEWHKNPFSAPNVKFKDVNVVPLTS